MDCDREGEAIAFEVLEICKEANPKLKIHRAHFSAVTYVDIMNVVYHSQILLILGFEEFTITRLQIIWFCTS